MKSLYFDDSLYENEMHFKIAQYLKENPLGDDWDELIIECDTEREYNDVLNALYRESSDKFIISGTSNNPMELIVAEDPRNNYRKFNESFLMDDSDK